MLDEQQEMSTAESETVSSPLPDAETLGAYAKLIPNGADRIMSLIERQTAHRHQRESADGRQAARGHWMAYTLAMALSGAGVYLGLQGHDWLAAALFTTTIGAVIAALVADKRPRDQRNKKIPSE
jgi:uncharacterized membrane protein